MAFKRWKSNQTCVCMLTIQLRTEISIQSMIIASASKVLSLSEWSATWLTDINICKCTILRITMKRSTSIFHYATIGNTADRVDDHKYLWFAISHDLRLEQHCNKNVNKALDCYVAFYLQVPKKWRVDLIRPLSALSLSMLQKLDTLTTLPLLMVLNTSIVLLPSLFTTTIDAQHL